MTSGTWELEPLIQDVPGAFNFILSPKDMRGFEITSFSSSYLLYAGAPAFTAPCLCVHARFIHNKVIQIMKSCEYKDCKKIADYVYNLGGTLTWYCSKHYKSVENKLDKIRRGIEYARIANNTKYNRHY